MSVQVFSPRRVNNLPSERRKDQPLGKRILTSGWTWTFFAALLLYTMCIFTFFSLLMADIEVPGGVLQGINMSALKQSAWLAAPTVIFWTVIFLITDRFRPQRPLLWFLALGWGASVAVVVSAEINTWASEHLNIVGDGNPAAQARTAVFIAPFVEEASKATVLFLLAIFVRYRLVSRTTLVCLGGLSAVGFAFTENILYYSRVIVFASQTIEVGDAAEALHQTVLLRGLWTSFGHPLFTVMTAFGIAIGIRSRSKVVRVLAPLAGFLLAAFGHMFFNSQAEQISQMGFMYWLVIVPLLLFVILYVIRHTLAQGKLISHRLADYVRVGWLLESDPEVFSRLRTRLYAGFLALTKGWSIFLATIEIQRAMTELAYLRDAETNGIVDQTANLRAEELLLKIRELRPNAMSDPRGLKISLPKLPKFRWSRSRVPLANQAAGGEKDAIAGYSAVDPNWKPPGE
ncbi:MAG: PrsW family intramembrane metalloprotease [Propionibacteriaceae bacterium]|nr:PrsW family intramembrane metalloprotease [Propionibacteriaceae bacterium]